MDTKTIAHDGFDVDLVDEPCIDLIRLARSIRFHLREDRFILVDVDGVGLPRLRFGGSSNQSQQVERERRLRVVA